jgi:putative membrane protein
MMAMFPCAGFGYGLWWIFPLLIVGMMVLCFFMMRGRMGSMMCRPGFHKSENHGEDASDSPLDILNKRYVRGEVNKEEYEEKKRVITGHN